MPVIVVANPKGGVGKSTLATQIAGYLASKGHSVMLGDVDRQQSSRIWLKLRPQGVHAATVTIRGVLAPGTAFDPDVVADAFWALHAEGSAPADSWRAEVEVTASGVRDPSPFRPSE